MAIEKIAVIGCGQMGLGIAESAAACGVEVLAIKLTSGDLDQPRRTLENTLDRRVARGKLTPAERTEILSRVHFSQDLDALGAVQLAIECCLEELDAKGEILARIESHLAPKAVLASNTSSLRLTELARSLKRPERFLALHFFNPVPAMKLVEVSATSETSTEALRMATEFCAQIDKTTVTIQDTPGYVVNRLLVPLMLQAIETLELGVASAEAIDVAMKLGCGHPMGPLALADLIGLDTCVAIMEVLHAGLGDEKYAPCPLLREHVAAGRLGRKSGQGFYTYS